MPDVQAAGVLCRQAELVLALATILRPDTTLDRVALVLVIPLLHPHILAEMRLKLVLSVALLVPCTLMPVMKDLWLVVRSGNANYYYFQTLVWIFFLCLGLLEFVSAAIRKQKAERRAAREAHGSR
jgi:hypothetical protein